MGKINSKKILKDYGTLKKIAISSFEHGKYEEALRTIFVSSGFMYTFNQRCCDDELELILYEIGNRLISVSKSSRKEKSILFFDGFGNESRGLMSIYVKALLEKGFEIVYVSYESLKGTTLEICRMLKKENIFYLKEADFSEQIKELGIIIGKCKIGKAMLYICPDDVVAVSAFSQYQGVFERYLVNLTDHAFWLGKNATDYIIEFRSYGANISCYHRNICKEQIFLLPFYPQIPQTEFKGLAFNTNGKKMIFSGGYLYKTFSSDNLYYKMVEYILNKDQDTIFFYVGDGDTSEIDKLKNKYPYRVYYSKERADFYEIMKRSYFYLSTYPYPGGLMTQYAVSAKKLPMTLLYEEIAGEQTVEKGKEAWCFEKYEEIQKEFDKLLFSKAYLKQQEKLIEGGVITPEKFADKLYQILINKVQVEAIKWKECDLSIARQTVIDNLNIRKYYGMFCRKKAFFLCLHFPFKFMLGLACNLYEHYYEKRC